MHNKAFIFCPGKCAETRQKLVGLTFSTFTIKKIIARWSCTKSSERFCTLRLNWQKFDKKGNATKAFLRGIYHHRSSSFAFSPWCLVTRLWRMQWQFRLFCESMTRQIALVPLVFLPHNNSNLHTISKNDKNRNKFLSRLGRWKY